MAYKCIECGHIFEKGEEKHWTESRGEFWGKPAEEPMTGCPHCKGDFEETSPCGICGSEKTEEEIVGGVCLDCLDNYKHDTDTCLKLGELEREEIELNSFLLSIFTRDEIEEALVLALNELKKYKPVDCSDFIFADAEWFGDTLRKEILKNGKC